MMNSISHQKSSPLEQPQRKAVLFPGQGSQMQGMGKILFAENPDAAEYLGRLSETVETDLVELLCQTPMKNDPVSVHLAMVASGLTIWEYQVGRGGRVPAFVAGHSLGEITALACSGVLSSEDGLRLARFRGECMAEVISAQSGGMLALVAAPIADLQRVFTAWRDTCAEPHTVWEANYNGPEQLVVSGTLESLADLAVFLKKERVAAIPLKTAGAFHTPMMSEAARKFSVITETFSVHEAQLPIVSSLTGRLLSNSQSLHIHLARQMIQPVQWLASMQFLQRAQVDTVVVAGSSGEPLESLAKQFGGWDVHNVWAAPFTE